MAAELGRARRRAARLGGPARRAGAALASTRPPAFGRALGGGPRGQRETSSQAPAPGTRPLRRARPRWACRGLFRSGSAPRRGWPPLGRGDAARPRRACRSRSARCGTLSRRPRTPEEAARGRAGTVQSTAGDLFPRLATSLDALSDGPQPAPRIISAAMTAPAVRGSSLMSCSVCVLRVLRPGSTSREDPAGRSTRPRVAEPGPCRKGVSHRPLCRQRGGGMRGGTASLA